MKEKEEKMVTSLNNNPVIPCDKLVPVFKNPGSKCDYYWYPDDNIIYCQNMLPLKYKGLLPEGTIILFPKFKLEKINKEKVDNE